MLNERQERELCFVAKVDNIEPIPGRDKVEAAIVGGWKVMVRKGTFQPGSLGVYFEIDSKVDYTKPEFAFTAKYKGKIKTQKFAIKDENGNKVGQFYSQGLLMPFEDLNRVAVDYKEGDFLTKELGVIYADAEDNKRKAKSDPNAKYKSMAGRHPKLFRNPIIKAIYKTGFGKKVLFLFFGKKKVDNAKAFPTHLEYIHKSDEERCENIPFILQDKDEWIKTVKIDGTSSLYLLERKGKKFEYWVCSRNVRQLDRNQECYHDDNVYWEVNDAYGIESALKDLLNNHPEWNYVAIQGESAGCTSSGAKIQGDPHKFGELRFFAYNFITSDIGRWGTVEGSKILSSYDIPWVPIIDAHYVLPDDFEEFKLSADGPCEASGASGNREGFVYRRAKFVDGKINSFKNVSREYLMKH